MEKLIEMFKSNFIAGMIVALTLSGGFGWVFAKFENLTEREKALAVQEQRFELAKSLNPDIENYNKNFSDYSRGILDTIQLKRPYVICKT